jgi:hypothetical protein
LMMYIFFKLGVDVTLYDLIIKRRGGVRGIQRRP